LVLLWRSWWLLHVCVVRARGRAHDTENGAWCCCGGRVGFCCGGLLCVCTCAWFFVVVVAACVRVCARVLCACVRHRKGGFSALDRWDSHGVVS
jgi:hypothetical protein